MPPVQVVDAFGVAAMVTFAGNVSLIEILVPAIAAVLRSAIVMVDVSNCLMVAGAKLIDRSIGTAVTERPGLVAVDVGNVDVKVLSVLLAVPLPIA